MCFNARRLVYFYATYNPATDTSMILPGTRRIEGKTAVITGASRGIGRASAVKLASDGAYVVINYAAAADSKYPGAAEQALRLSIEAGGSGEIYDADVADTARIRAMLRDIAAKRGTVDILVNNAGICPMLELFEITEGLWD